MCTTFGAKIIHKEDSTSMMAVAIGMDVGRLFGAKGIAPAADFMSKFTTTIGNRIYMPAVHRSPPDRFVEVATHEFEHVDQWNRAHVEMPWLYLTEPEARVHYEADAYAAGLAITYWLTGLLPADTVEHAVALLVGSYHLRPEDANLATDLLRSHVASIKSGLAMSKAARVAIEWFTTNHPDLKHS
jgi:hypothetical protein